MRRKLSRKTVSGIMLIFFLVSALSLTFNIRPTKSWTATVYIKVDGSIDPPDAPIVTYDNITYTLTGNITSSGDGIIVEIGNIIIDGNGYVLQGSESRKGLYLSGINNVTIKNMNIKNFDFGIHLINSSHNCMSGNEITSNIFEGVQLDFSSDNIISGNSITNNRVGIHLDHSSNNSISENNVMNSHAGIGLYYSDNNNVSRNEIANNNLGIYLELSSKNSISGNKIAASSHEGVYLLCSSDNSISGSNITNNDLGIHLDLSSDNIISGNKITNNGCGIYLSDSPNNNIFGNSVANNNYGICLGGSSDNIISGNKITNNGCGIYIYNSSECKIYHNNFINNIIQVYSSNSVNVWDDGYPSGGNYWSDCACVDLYCSPYQNETGSDGIGDKPYNIDANNQDNYPLTKPYGGPYDIGITDMTLSKKVVGQGLDSSISVSLKLINYGIRTETFNVTVYANTAMIATFTNIALSSRNSMTLTFACNTSGLVKGNYTVSAYVTSVKGETDMEDNTLINGWVYVTIPGDADCDGDIDIYDVVLITSIYGSKIGDLYYNPNVDWLDDGIINIYDVVIATSRYGEKDP